MPEASRPAELFELDRPTCLALLTTQHVGRLIIDAATPVIRVVNYTAFEHTIMFRSDPGPQIDAIVDAPVVFEADMFDERTQSGWSVVVRGIARDLSDHLAGLGAVRRHRRSVGARPEEPVDRDHHRRRHRPPAPRRGAADVGQPTGLPVVDRPRPQAVSARRRPPKQPGRADGATIAPLRIHDTMPIRP